MHPSAARVLGATEAWSSGGEARKRTNGRRARESEEESDARGENGRAAAITPLQDGGINYVVLSNGKDSSGWKELCIIAPIATSAQFASVFSCEIASGLTSNSGSSVRRPRSIHSSPLFSRCSFTNRAHCCRNNGIALLRNNGQG